MTFVQPARSPLVTLDNPLQVRVSLLLPVGLLITVVAVVTVCESVHLVEAGRVEALLVFGELRAVLHPGLNFVPPFVSKTYPIDTATMTADAGDRRVELPQEFREVREEPDRSRESSDFGGPRT